MDLSPPEADSEVIELSNEFAMLKNLKEEPLSPDGNSSQEADDNYDIERVVKGTRMQSKTSTRVGPSSRSRKSNFFFIFIITAV